jgi:hypothetical protein
MDGKRSSLSKVERALVEYSADSELESLVNAGCERDRIMRTLALAFLTDESWRTLLEMDLRAFKVTLRQVRDCAAIIDRLNRSNLINHVSIEIPDIRFAGVHQSPTLPDRLREYANGVESLRRFIGPEHKIRMHVWKAWLVGIVLEQTGKAHDPEVSALIAAVLNNPKYSEKAHQAWRLKHSSLVEKQRIW